MSFFIDKTGEKPEPTVDDSDSDTDNSESPGPSGLTTKNEKSPLALAESGSDEYYSEGIGYDDSDDDDSDDPCIIIPNDSDDSNDEFIAISDPNALPRIQKLKISSNSTKKKEPEMKLFDNVYLLGNQETGTLVKTREKEMKEHLKVKSLAMQPGIEQLEFVPNPNKSEKRLKKERQTERAKTKGSDWYNLPAPEVTEEVQRDLEVLQMRSVLDPKTFYKKNDLKVLPKYFQVGKVEDNAADFYNSRIPKKERKRTMVEELMADAEFQQRSKKKFKEIIVEKERVNSVAHKRAKRLKKRK